MNTYTTETNGFSNGQATAGQMPGTATIPGQYDALPIPPAELAAPRESQPAPAPECQTSKTPTDDTPSQPEPDTGTLGEDDGDDYSDVESDDNDEAGDDGGAGKDGETAATAEDAESSKEADDAAEKERRAAHEAAEQKRKAEWDARQQAKKAAREEALRKMDALTDSEVLAASMKKAEDDVERLTRRNMKLCVLELVQTRCLDDPAFARLTMHPDKSMLNCFHYINRKAKDYIIKEMKDNDIPQSDIYGNDVPDELVYKWAEDYFQDPDAEEDKEKEEKFVPKPYVGTIGRKGSGTKKSAKKASSATKSPKNGSPEKKDSAADNSQGSEQISLFDIVQEVPV